MRLTDTLTGLKREFAPPGPEVKMYVCGVTPYSSCHVGHAMSYVYFDVLRRYLEFRGYRVRHVQNFTDIDDKIITRAQAEGVAPQALAERHIQDYFAETDALNILRAHVYPRATQEIPQIIEMVRSLVETGHAYVAGGDVYFRVLKARDYGKLSHRSLDGMMAGARVEVGEQKEHPMDFALWKTTKPGEPSWESPWGPGRPGWHIECSAMSTQYLGTTLDIHGGGQDLIFPHHENEIAQSEAYTGTTPFVRFWVHNGLLQMAEDKMSKSLGNVIPLREALKRFSPDALRLFFLTSHYRSPLTYSDEAVLAQERAVERLRRATELDAASSGSGPALSPEEFRQRFVDAMEDDLNTPQALAALFDLAREVNRAHAEGGQVREACIALRQMAGMLGLTLRPPPQAAVEVRPFVELLVEMRGRLREQKQFALADQIRERLRQLGVALEDTPNGTTWTLRNP